MFETPSASPSIGLGHVVTVSESDSFVVVRVVENLPDQLGLQIYARETSKLISRSIRRAIGEGARLEGERCLSFPDTHRKIASDWAHMLRKRIKDIASKPIDRKHVEGVLRITGAECNRWTKDGRIPHSGSLHVTRGTQQVQCATYLPATIAQLARQPDLIESWRRQDQA